MLEEPVSVNKHSIDKVRIVTKIRQKSCDKINNAKMSGRYGNRKGGHGVNGGGN